MTSSEAVLQSILEDARKIGQVRTRRAPDVTYVSLNFSNPDLERVTPWAGPSKGAGAIMQTPVDVGRYRTKGAFEQITCFGAERYAAPFGSMTCFSAVLGNQVRSPSADGVEVSDGPCARAGHMDGLATMDSFRRGGQWMIRSDPNGGQAVVRAAEA